ncbi:MAG: N-acetylmuramoyl-L-alanine amidase [Anaerolineaceae bacterium]|nr:N-acetylmuramoyl-L-alanine amidase [Anaerolineaceae bacterium]
MSEPTYTPPFPQKPEPTAPTPQPGTPAPRQNTTPKKKSARFGIFNSIQMFVTYAFLAATLFTLFTPNNLFSSQMVDRLFTAWQANPTNVAQVTTPASSDSAVKRIGIVSGHYQNDSGSVCSDGLTEQQVNLSIATLVKQKLEAEGYTVDLLAEFDDRLSQYKAIALISIHNDSCDYVNDQATGFKVAAAMHSAYPEKASRLTACLVDRYAKDTGLPYHANTITNDMTYYHAFDEINTDTTAAIIETGFLNLDRQILTQHTDEVAQGIVDGLNCFIHNENISSTATPVATP